MADHQDLVKAVTKAITQQLSLIHTPQPPARKPRIKKPRTEEEQKAMNEKMDKLRQLRKNKKAQAPSNTPVSTQ